MSIQAGTKLGVYEIVARIGEGGMGEVWKARDARLGRVVAVKVLPLDKSGDPERNRRFIQEAKAASALNHPNIVTVHDIGTENGVVYLVMELIDGQPLDALIPPKGMPVLDVLNIATQVADAMSKAHAAGIVHRDLKPANVMLTPDRRVKILDFGLAKLDEPAPADDAYTNTSAGRTVEGTVMGTAAYMSPEQTEGKALDARSDIFSFGVVLYQMCNGERPFRGDSQASVMAAVLREDPKPLADVRTDLPPELVRVITRCLRKDPTRRAQSMADLKVVFEDLKEDVAAGRVVSAPPAAAGVQNRKHLALISATAIVIVLVAVTWMISRRTLPPPEADQALQPMPLTSYPGNEGAPSLSPDATQVAFTWNGDQLKNFDVYVKIVGSGTPLRITTDERPDVSPKWSPDGRNIAFLRYLTNDTFSVLLVSPLGGPERKVGQFFTRTDLGGPLASFCWTWDSRYVFVSGSDAPNLTNRILRVSVETGEVKTLTELEGLGLGYARPALSPDGRVLAVVREQGQGLVELLSLSSSYEKEGLRKLDTAGGNISDLAWTADSRELIIALAVNNPLTLFRVAIDGGTPRPLSWSGAGAGEPDIARRGGRMVFARRFRDTNIWQVSLDKLKRGEPAMQKLASSSFRDVYPRYSPDGKRLAFYSNRSGSVQVWTADADGSRESPLTSMDPAATTGTPRWSPDGQYIAFDSNAGGNYQIYVISADGGQPRNITNDPSENYVSAWSPDGRWIYFTSTRSGATEIWKVPVAGGAPEQVTHKGGQTPDISPDGKWLYYAKGDGLNGLWKMPLAGGDETQVIDQIYRFNYFVTADGIYFIPARETDRSSSVRFLNFTTGKSAEVFKIEKQVDLGLALSPDGRYLLFTQVDYSGQDLMVVENFK